MDHIQWEIAAEFLDLLYPFRGPQSVTGIEAFREGAVRSTRSAFRMTIGNDGCGRAGSPAKIIDEALTKDKAYGPNLLSEYSTAFQAVASGKRTESPVPTRGRLQVPARRGGGVDGLNRLL